MKLIGSYTSPFVRKISVILLEKTSPSHSSMNLPTTTRTASANTIPWARCRCWSPTAANAGMTLPLSRNTSISSARRRQWCHRTRKRR